MVHNISQILNIKISNNISRIVCANSKIHTRFVGFIAYDICQCKNCDNFICELCTISNKEKCAMCWQMQIEKCNLCEHEPSFRCWLCGKQTYCMWFCNNGNFELSPNKNGSMCVFCSRECVENYNHTINKSQ